MCLHVKCILEIPISPLAGAKFQMRKRNEMSWSEQKRQKVYEMFGGKCAYCGEEMDFSNLQIDHKNPKQKQNRNHLSNLFPSCLKCNIIKKDRNISEFRKYLFNIPPSVDCDTFRLLCKLDVLKKRNAPDFLFYFERQNAGEKQDC